MANEVRPYMVPSADCVTWASWRFSGPDDDPVPAAIEGWDSSSDLTIHQRIQVDAARLRAEAGLAPSDDLVVTVSWLGSKTDMVDIGYRELLEDDQDPIVTLIGTRLGPSVTIRTTVSLAAARPGGHVGSVRFPGSVLLQHTQSVVLQGSGAMFPIALVDFAGTSLGPSSSWHLQVPQDLDSPFLGGFLLLINSRDNELLGAITATRRTQRQDLLLDDLEAGVARSLAVIALQEKQELAWREWPEDTTGSVLSRYLNLADREVLVTPASGAETGTFESRLSSALRDAGYGRAFA